MDRIIVEDKLGAYEALIDSEDRDLIAGFTWRPLRTDSDVVYAQASRRRMFVYMHRLIAGAGPKEDVDHANRNGLDNRKANLRVATDSENQANIPKRLNAGGRPRTSQYKGVHWDKSRNRWTAAMTVDGRSKHLGRFRSELEAAKAYDAAALASWGPFAILNFEDL